MSCDDNIMKSLTVRQKYEKCIAKTQTV